MSFSSPDNLSLGSLGADAGIPSLNVADVPANVRNGNQQARQAYVEGLAFEQVLVNQLTQQMSTALSGESADGSSDGSSSDGSDSSSGGLPGASAFTSLIPQALTQGIMAGGGLGIADEFAAAVDPSINLPQSTDAATKVSGTGAAGNESGTDSSQASGGQVGL